MGTKERAPLGFGTELDEFDPVSWGKNAPVEPKPKVADARRIAEASGFRSREPNQAAPDKPKQRRRRTGRNVQFNIKTKPETIEAFCAIADKNGWGLGETFEIATELLAKRETEIDS